MHVVILAAGRGSRLGPLGDDTPKWLLRVGDATIADRQLAGIAEAGADTPVSSLSVVGGHALEALEHYVSARGVDGPAVIENPDYEAINNWYSVLLAARALPAEGDQRLVILNGDLFARPEWYAEFIRAAARTAEDALIAVDLARNLTDESMKVAARGEDQGVLDAIGKVGIESPVGEYVGMLMARGAALEAFRSRLESFVGREEHRNEWYERAVGLTAAAGTDWRIWGTPDSDWVEIDDDGDFEQATRLAADF